MFKLTPVHSRRFVSCRVPPRSYHWDCVFWHNFCGMKRTCWTTGSWSFCLCLEVASSIPAGSKIIYRFLCEFICIYLCWSIRIKPTNMYVCVYVSIWECLCVGIYVYVCVCMYMCMCVRIYIYIYIYHGRLRFRRSIRVVAAGSTWENGNSMACWWWPVPCYLWVWYLFHWDVGFKIQWNLSVTTTSIIKFIACDLFSNVF